MVGHQFQPIGRVTQNTVKIDRLEICPGRANRKTRLVDIKIEEGGRETEQPSAEFALTRKSEGGDLTEWMAPAAAFSPAVAAPANRVSAAVMALVIFFVPDPAKAVAEMVRVVAPGGAVATYAWDNVGGGSPTEPIHAEVRTMGLTPLGPPSAGASRMDVLRDFVGGCGPQGGRNPGDHRAADICRFRRLLEDQLIGDKCWPHRRRDGRR